MEKAVRQVRLRSLDGLKGIAACIIAFCWHHQHFYTETMGPPSVSQFLPFAFDYGYLMVELFFMLSGFGMLCGYCGRVMSGDVGFGSFMRRRLARLYPLFLGSTLIVVALEYVHLSKTGGTFVYPNFDIYHFVLNVLLMQDGFLGIEWSYNSPSWFLSILLILYVVFYLVCRLAKSRAQVYGSFAVLALAGLIIIQTHVNLPMLNELTGRGLACFSIGALLTYPCLVWEGGRTKRWSVWLGLAFLVFLYVEYRLFGDAPFGDMRMVFILAGAPLLIYCVVMVPWLDALLSSGPMLWLGSLSFGIYLLHFPVQCALRDADLCLGLGFDYGSNWFWLAYIGVVLAVAMAYRYLVEPRLAGGRGAARV